jgi:protein-S-isoprenylcysteine O-methyltransferase Ste14
MLDNPMKKFFSLPIVLVFSFVVGMQITNLTGLQLDLISSWNGVIALFLLLIAISIVLFAAYQFKKSNTTLDPRAPEKTSSLVSEGIFGISRNPMYLGFLLALTAAAIYSCNLVNFLFLPGFIWIANRLYIIPEEKALTQLFGDAYTQYLNNVRRWI